MLFDVLRGGTSVICRVQCRIAAVDHEDPRRVVTVAGSESSAAKSGVRPRATQAPGTGSSLARAASAVVAWSLHSSLHFGLHQQALFVQSQL